MADRFTLLSGYADPSSDEDEEAAATAETKLVAGPSSSELPPQRIVLSQGLPLQLQDVPVALGVGLTLSRRQRLAFLATNLPYFFLAHRWLSSEDDVPTATLSEDFLEYCASMAMHGALVANLAIVSTYWHGAQCQLASLLYCYREETGAKLHSATWIRRLMAFDMFCALMTLVVGIGCFGPWRPISWLAVPFVAFAIGARAKRKKRFGVYAVFHGLWHVLSAAAIYQLVSVDRVAFSGGCRVTELFGWECDPPDIGY